MDDKIFIELKKFADWMNSEDVRYYFNGSREQTLFGHEEITYTTYELIQLYIKMEYEK